MKESDVHEASRLLQNVKHVDDLLVSLPGEVVHITVGGNTLHVSPDDPQRPLLDQAVTDLARYIRTEADAKLKTFALEPDQKPSDITGFPEDDLPPPVDPV